MDMEDLKSNSYKNREKEQEKEKKLEKVTKGEVVVKKAGIGKKLADIFISNGSENIKDYIVYEVLVPAVKSTLSDVGISVIEMLFGSKRGSTSRSSGYTSYNSIYKKQDEPRKVYSPSKRFDSCDDIIVETRWEGEEVLDRLATCITEYGVASVADLYELVGKTTSYTDNKYGWSSIATARIEKCREGYLISLPPTTKLD